MNVPAVASDQRSGASELDSLHLSPHLESELFIEKHGSNY